MCPYTTGLLIRHMTEMLQGFHRHCVPINYKLQDKTKNVINFPPCLCNYTTFLFKHIIRFRHCYCSPTTFIFVITYIRYAGFNARQRRARYHHYICILGGVRVAKSLIFYVVFVDCYLFFWFSL